MKSFYAHNLFALALAIPATIAQQQAPQPQQPAHHGVPGTFEILGKSLVNAQQVSHSMMYAKTPLLNSA